LAGAATLMLTGAIAASIYLGSLPSLWSTWYGRTLSAKLLVFIGVASCGYANWRRLHRPSRQERGAGADVHQAPSLIWLEVALATAVIVITAVLTELEHP
ncbi:MAG TPA: CopD family protein, partial [Vicinamibacterales bacterium]|nr:CopD family protein [Vicinamibacterales bacterium]